MFNNDKKRWSIHKCESFSYRPKLIDSSGIPSIELFVFFFKFDRAKKEDWSKEYAAFGCSFLFDKLFGFLLFVAFGDWLN